MKISAVLVAKDEEKNIQRCLKSLKDFADEIIVVDDGSTDGTVELAKKYTDKIFQHESKGYVEPARNFAISKASGDWILIIDADEELPQSLAKKLSQIANSGEFDFVKMPRKNIIFGKWIENTGWWPDYQIRFFKNGKVKWQDKIHSVPSASGKEKILEPNETNAITHYNYQSVSQFVEKLNNYTTWEVLASEVGFRSTNVFEKPSEEFVSRFYSKKGYEDGFHGVALSRLMAFYSLVTELKIWEKEGFPDSEADSFELVEKELKKTQKLFWYWVLTEKIKRSKNPLKKLSYKVRRKL